MRVNVYAEEMTDNVEIITKEIDGQQFTGLRFYLHLPVTDPVTGAQHAGPFIHHPGDDDSSAVTFWGKQNLRVMLRKALAMLHGFDSHPSLRARLRDLAGDLRYCEPESLAAKLMYEAADEIDRLAVDRASGEGKS